MTTLCVYAFFLNIAYCTRPCLLNFNLTEFLWSYHKPPENSGLNGNTDTTLITLAPV